MSFNATFAGFQAAEVEGVPVFFRPDRRFKTFCLTWNSRRPFDGRAAARSLLPSMLTNGTQRDPDRPALALRMENLYGASVAPATHKVGESHLLRATLDCVAGEFLPERPDQLGQGLELLADLLVRPRLDGDGFPVDAFERERLLARNDVLALFDDKARYAWDQALRRACEGEPVAIPEHGTLEDIDALQAGDPELARQDFLHHGEMCVVAHGVLPDGDELLECVRGFLAEMPSWQPQDLPQPATRPSGETRRHTDRASMQQAKLVLIHRLPLSDDPRLWMARRLFVAMLGGGTQSRLFQDVREKQSLAYYAQCSLDRHKGLLSTHVGLDEAAATKVEAEVEKHAADLRAGNFTAEELEIARAGVLSTIATIDDSIRARMSFVEDQWMLGLDRTPQDLADAYREIGAQEVCASAEGLWLDYSYLLAPEEA